MDIDYILDTMKKMGAKKVLVETRDIVNDNYQQGRNSKVINSEKKGSDYLIIFDEL